MKIFALTGPSGTGKSYQAPGLMVEKEIEMLVDDGLLIYQDAVEAGISAKRQKTKVGAIKTAIFTGDEHAEAVAKRIREIDPDSILIIGTSDRMVDIIADRLELGKVDEYIHIEDISTPEELEKAEKSRELQGKHIIPVPTVQLKRDFAGYFMDPERLKRSAREMTDKAQEAIKHPGHLLRRNRGWDTDKTVVRPTYSYLGDFIISDRVIKDIAVCIGRDIEGIKAVLGVYENTEPDNLKLTVVVALDREYSSWETAIEFQKKLTETVEEMTAFNVMETDIEIRKLI